jgi:ferric-dicitrate binding protein FerR (iron transport regulator)
MPARPLLLSTAMDQTRDAASFTGQTLAWFDQGEAQAAMECETAAERPVPRRRVRRAVGFLLVIAIAGLGGVLVARHYGVPIDLPADLRLPWE